MTSSNGGLDKPKILIYSTKSEDPELGLSESCCRILKQDFELVLPVDVQNDPDVRHHVKGAIVLTPWEPMMNKLLHDLPNVKVICAGGAGTDHVDFNFCRSRGIMVGHNPDCVTMATADLAMGLLLAVSRRIPEGMAIRRAGKATKLLSKDVSGATLGVVGMGRIGFQVARRARGFDMNILYHNRNRREQQESQVEATFCTALHEMLPRCDFVVVTCPLTQETRNMFGEKEFRLMRRGAIFINVARGEIVDTECLVQALETNLIGGAGLDLTHPAKLPGDHPLLNRNDVIVLPHMGTSTEGTLSRTSEGLLKNFRAVLIEGGRPLNEAHPVM